ncbi:MAG: MarR family transcriptional regulator [Spirochaetes bacterium]|nr:MarR family transcriptional regulator [Spirochaetota bacterium]
MKEDNRFEDMSDLFFRILSRFHEIERIPRDFGTGDPLYPSEIHMVQAIGRRPGINVTELAGHLGITKGAVPKMVRRLEKKRLVRRYRDGDNRKEIHLELTRSGIAAYRGHERFHTEIDAVILRLMNSMSSDTIAAVREVFIQLDEYAEGILSRG